MALTEYTLEIIGLRDQLIVLRSKHRKARKNRKGRRRRLAEQIRDKERELKVVQVADRLSQP